MQVTRRQALALTLAASVAGRRAASADAPSDDRALFWELRSGAAASVIFGYARVAASLAADIVDEGARRAAAAKRLIQDFPATARLPPIKLDPALSPVVSKLDAKTADAFRAVVRQSFPRLLPAVDKMPGVEATMLLIAEGQTPPNPTVGGAVVQRALQAGRPSTILMSDVELAGMVAPPNLAALDKRIGQETIAHMLDVRARDGPIGRQFERLYAARRGGDLHRLAADLAQRGAFSPTQEANSDAIKAILTGRLEAALKGAAADSAFVLLPLDALLGDDGVIAALRQHGATVTPVA